jgi:lactate dehydrogenase-like 2-hydroxyacid dehydrogenase
MNDIRATALQLCPLLAHLETGLVERFDVIRWFELDDAARAAFLDSRAASVRAVVTGGHIGCGNAMMEALPSLGIIAINGVGFDKVDLDFARGRGIRVTTTANTLEDDVADLAIGLTIGLLRGIPAGDAHVRAGNWPSSERPLARKVTGCRFGIVGLGRIGSAIAERLVAFGPVSYTGTAPKPVPYRFEADLAALARDSDVLVLACPANAATRHLIGAAVLEALGPKGYLVNVARGSVVDEAALIAALDAGTLAGAALDVFEDEPNVPEALRASDRTLLTPHIASATAETRIRMAELVLENLDAFVQGGPLPTALV